LFADVGHFYARAERLWNGLSVLLRTTFGFSPPVRTAGPMG
jgi:hypothetical protein